MFLTEGSLVICNHYKTCTKMDCILKFPYKLKFDLYSSSSRGCIGNFNIPIKIFSITEFQSKMIQKGMENVSN